MLFNFLKAQKIISIPFNKLLFDDNDEKSFYAHLQQTTLGMQYFYWLGNIFETFPKKHKKNAHEFLAAYNGPNIVVYCASSTEAAPGAIKIPRLIDQQDFNEIISFFGKEFHEKKLNLINKIFEQAPTITLDFSCSIIAYLELTSIQMLDQLYEYLLKTLKTQPSLSLLSEYFFSKRSHEFFVLWNKLANEYPEIFWITFWSEQLWRAYYTKKFLTQQNFSKARKMSFRLPYSFIKRDWEKIKLKDLADLHDQMYCIDYALKIGSTFCSLEKFYLNHFLSK
jgi:hypothetical protein